MPGTAINQINYGSKANQQTSNDIDGILNEVQQIDKSAGSAGTGQYNANGQSGPTIQVNPVPKQFQYDPTPPAPRAMPPQMAQGQQYQQPQQVEQFQSGPVTNQGSSWEWMRSMKMTLLMMLLLTIFFNPMTTSLWKKIPFIEQHQWIATMSSSLLFSLSFYIISLFI